MQIWCTNGENAALEVPRKHKACRSWWSRWWQSHCRRFSPLQGYSRTQSHTAFLADKPAWSPATPLLWHTWERPKTILNPLKKTFFSFIRCHDFYNIFTRSAKKTSKPEEHQDSLRKSLKIVVAVNLGPIHHCNFSKHLKAQKNIQSINKQYNSPQKK